MVREILKLRTDNGLGPNNPTFHDIELTDYRFSSPRMGMPTLTATLMWPTCLDSEWTSKEYVELRGEKYYIRQVQSSEKNNDDARYQHSLEFKSEREQLAHVYFYDVVPSWSATYDKPNTNSTEFQFFGTIREYADRLNCAFRYAGIGDSILNKKTSLTDADTPVGDGYCVVVSGYGEYDLTISKEMSFSDQYLWDALAEGFNQYEIPFAFRGKKIVFNEYVDVTDHVFKYGHDNSLLSVKKVNANARIINRITFKGSSENIPYYYPNETEYGHISLSVPATNKELTANKLTLTHPNRLVGVLTSDQKVTLENERRASVAFGPLQYNDGESFKAVQYGKWYEVDNKFGLGNSVNYTYRINVTVGEVGTAVINSIIGQLWMTDKVQPNAAPTLADNLINDETFKITAVTKGSDDFIDSASVVGNTLVLSKLPVGTYTIEFVISWRYSLHAFWQINSISAVPGGISAYYWQVGNRRVKDLSSVGVSFNGTPSPAMIGESFGWTASGLMPYQTSLMPPKYRATLGAERFYNALNNTYPASGGGFLFFKNPYTAGNPNEYIHVDETIKPTIEGITNASSQLMGVIAGIAYDDDDNDSIKTVTDDKDKNDAANYEHSFFYIKLNRFDGPHGFDLFGSASQTDAMTIQMTSGRCNGCKFKIQVAEFTDGDIEVWKNPVQVSGPNGGIVAGTYTDKVDANNPQDFQQNTTQNTLWICVQKDASTFGVIMPNHTHNYLPAVGDTFNIVNIDLPQGYITAAEELGERVMLDFMADNNEGKFNFEIAASRIFFAENKELLADLNENSRIKVEYDGNEYIQYVSEFGIECASGDVLPNVKLTLANTLTAGSSFVDEVVAKAVDAASVLGGRSGGGGGGLTTELADKRYLRKDKADRTEHRLSSDSAFEVGSFVSGASGGILFNDPDTGHSSLEVDYLKVRMKAMFETLEIAHVQSIGGKLIISPGGSIVISFVEERTDCYRCYFKQQEEQKGADCRFIVGDDAYCQSFNISAGTHSNASNQFYWMAVTAVSNEESYIELSKADCAALSGIPQAGDTVCQLGSDDETRQSAIVLSTVDMMSPNVTLYDGITDFTFAGKEVVDYGVDPATNKAYFHVYGDSYIGDKEGNSYVKYNNLLKEMEIKAKLSVQSTIGDQSLADYIQQVSPPVEQEDIEDFVNAIIDPRIDGIQNQIDGVIETWFYNGVPSLSTYPASEWNTDALKIQHLGDLYYDNDTGTAYRFSQNAQGYYWNTITDDAITKALAAAQKAQDTADGKRRVFTSQPTATDAYDIGDLWVNATYGTQYSNDLLRCVTSKAAGAAFNISHWTRASKYTDDSALNTFIQRYETEIKGYKEQLDGKIETWYFAYDPTTSNKPASDWDATEKSEHAGDLFFNTTTKKIFRWTGTAWESLTDPDIQAALDAAADAQDTADNKRRVFMTQPTTPYDIGDLWIDNGPNGKTLKVCTSGRATGAFASGDWVVADDASLNVFATTIENSLNGIRDQIDQKAQTWYQSTNPATAWTTAEAKAEHKGDLWYCTTDIAGTNFKKDTTWYWNGTSWVQQNIPQSVFDTIDGKAAIFISKPTTGYKKNDLWFLEADYTLSGVAYKSGTLVVAKNDMGTAWSANDWVKKDRYTDDTLAQQAKAAADAAKAAADAAKSVADAAKNRLDQWAADGVISPTEKQGIKDEIARIDADKAHITAEYTRYGLGTPTAYDNAYTTYRAQLVTLSAATPENITIPSTFAANQTAYYNQRTTALNAIADAAKAFAQAVADNGKIYARGTGLNHSANRMVQVNGKTIVNGTGRGLTLTVINRTSLALVSSTNYDAFGSAHASMATALNALSTDVIAIITSWDAWWHANNAALIAALENFGGSLFHNGSSNQSNYRQSYVLIGMKGLGKGNGLERLEGQGANDPYAEISTTVINGICQGWNVNQAVYDTYDYLTEALKGSTVINGGLVLSSMFKLGTWTGSGNNATLNAVYAGMNGVYANGRTIASWWGGDMVDLFDANDTRLSPVPVNSAKSLVRMDGSAYFANGNIGFRADGSGWLGNDSTGIKFTSTGVMTFGSGVTFDVTNIEGLKTTLDSLGNFNTGLTTLLEPVIVASNGTVTALSWAQASQANAIRAKVGFYSDSFVSGRGVGISTGGSGGVGGAVDLLTKWGNYSASNADTFALSAGLGYDLHTRVTSLEGGGSLNAFNVAQAGVGNAVTEVSLSTDKRTLTVTKGYLGYLKINDIRGAERLPSYYQEQGLTTWLNNSGTPTGNWYSGIHMKGWTAGYASWELCAGSTTNVSDQQLYFRVGMDATWQPWQTVITSQRLVASTDVSAMTVNGLFVCDTDGNASTLANSPFTNSFMMLTHTCYNSGTDVRRPRLAVNAYGDMRVFNDRDTAGNGGVWYDVLTSKNYATTLDSRYVTLATEQTITGAKRFSNSIAIAQTAGTGVGLSLYSNIDHVLSYGILFAITSTYGKHGAVQGDWATYFTMDGAVNRGWVFRHKQQGCVASISGEGKVTANSFIKSGGTASQFLMADGSVKALTDITSAYVTALGTSGNYLTWTKNGATNNITVPYATNTSNIFPQSAGDLNATSLNRNGIYSWANTAANRPGSYGVLFQWSNAANPVSGTNSHWITQLGSVTDGGGLWVRTRTNTAAWMAWERILTSANFNSLIGSGLTAYVKKAGDTMTGALNFANNTANKVGDDVFVGDANFAGNFCLLGANGNTGLSFLTYNGGWGSTASRYAMTWNGANMTASSSALFTNLNADMLDGYHLDSVRGYRVNHPSINAALSVGNVPFNAFGMQHGTPMYNDPEFASGNNSVGLYNNAANGNVVITRIADSQSSANSSGYILQITVTGAASPNLGGFYQNIFSRANAVFMQIFRAKIPVGYRVNQNSNNMGSGYSDVWITSQEGTGKWEWYGRIVYCGASGTFSSGGHVSLSGTTPTASAPLYWYLSHCQIWDLTKNNYGAFRAKFADALSTARTIWGQSFNGTANISGNMTGVGSITGSGPIALTSSNSNHIIALHPTLAAGGYSQFAVGKASSNYNRANLTYWHVADGSTSNYIGLGLFGADKILNILASGNVGIGTTTPAYKLDVNGNTRVVGNITGTGNFVMGGLAEIQGGVRFTYANNRGYCQLGNSTNRNGTIGGWSAVALNELIVDSATTQFNGSIKIGNVTLSYDSANGGLHVSGGGLYTDSYVSGRGVGTSTAASFLPTTGGTMTGAIYFGGSNAAITYTDNYLMFRGGNGINKLALGASSFRRSQDAPIMTLGETGFRWTNIYTTTIDVTSTALVSNLNADLLDGYHANGLFTALSVSGTTLSVTVGGTTKTATLPSSSGGTTTGSYLPLSGGTLTGDLRLKDSANYGRALYFGDGSYCYLKEATDDALTIYAAKGINLTCDTSAVITTSTLVPASNNCDIGSETNKYIAGYFTTQICLGAKTTASDTGMIGISLMAYGILSLTGLPGITFTYATSNLTTDTIHQQLRLTSATQLELQGSNGSTSTGNLVAKVTAPSDATMKTVTGNVNLTAEQVAAAPAVNFIWRDSGIADVGSIAQYWRTILPLTVGKTGAGTLTFAYERAALLSAIVTARRVLTVEKRVEAAEAEIASLKAEVAEYKAQLAALGESPDNE